MSADFDTFMAATIPVSRADGLADLDRRINAMAHDLALWKIRREESARRLAEVSVVQRPKGKATRKRR